jgi:hypothetical protein
MAVLFALGAATQARAVTPDVQATTLMQLRQDPRDGVVVTQVPVYTLFNLQARKVKVPWKTETDVVVSSWGRMDGAAATVDKRLLNGDINLAYVESRNHLGSVRAGRQLVFDGVARGAHLDGVSGTVRPWKGLGASVYAGMPVVPLLEDHRGLAMAGGRLSWRQNYDSEVGVSGIHVMQLGRTAQQHVGIDGRVQLVPTLVLGGLVRWSTVQATNTPLALWPRGHCPNVVDMVGGKSCQVDEWKGSALTQGIQDRAARPEDGILRGMPALAEADLTLTWQPIYAFQVAGVYRRTSPSLFIPRTSIFSVFSSETRDQLGGSLAARLNTWGTLDADGAMLVTPKGLGFQAGTRGTARVAMSGTTVGAQARVLKVPTNGYLSGRVFGTQRLPYALSTTLDADVYLLENPVHGQRFTSMISWTNAFAFVPGWDVAVQLAAGSSPLALARVEALARVSYNGGVRLP